MQSDSKNRSVARTKCPDCTMCQGCSEVRCRACKGGKCAGRKKKLSLQEQIALFNKFNPNLTAPASENMGCNCREKDRP